MLSVWLAESESDTELPAFRPNRARSTSEFVDVSHRNKLRSLRPAVDPLSGKEGVVSVLSIFWSFPLAAHPHYRSQIESLVTLFLAAECSEVDHKAQQICELKARSQRD